MCCRHAGSAAMKILLAFVTALAAMLLHYCRSTGVCCQRGACVAGSNLRNISDGCIEVQGRTTMPYCSTLTT